MTCLSPRCTTQESRNPSNNGLNGYLPSLFEQSTFGRSRSMEHIPMSHFAELNSSQTPLSGILEQVSELTIDAPVHGTTSLSTETASEPPLMPSERPLHRQMPPLVPTPLMPDSPELTDDTAQPCPPLQPLFSPPSKVVAAPVLHERAAQLFTEDCPPLPKHTTTQPVSTRDAPPMPLFASPVAGQCRKQPNFMGGRMLKMRKIDPMALVFL